jgi:hypothetical protein
MTSDRAAVLYEEAVKGLVAAAARLLTCPDGTLCMECTQGLSEALADVDPEAEERAELEREQAEDEMEDEDAAACPTTGEEAKG